jgi:hypothetical protein
MRNTIARDKDNTMLFLGSLAVAVMLGWIAKSSRQMQPDNKCWPAYTGFGNPS